MYFNYTCVILVFGALVALRLYISSSGDLSARWLVIRYLPLFVIGFGAWLVAFLMSSVAWIAKGTANTPTAERAAALTLPICTAVLSFT